MLHRFFHSLVVFSWSCSFACGWTLPRSSQLGDSGQVIRPFRHKQPRLPRDVVITPEPGPFQVPYLELKESAFWDRENFDKLLQQGTQLYGKSLHPLAARWINCRLKRINLNNDPQIAISIDKFTSNLSRDGIPYIDQPSICIEELLSTRVGENNLEQYILLLWDYFQLNYFKTLIPSSLDMEFCLSDTFLDTVSFFPYCENDIYAFWDGDSLALPVIIFYRPLLFDSNGRCFQNLLKLTVFRSACELFYNLYWSGDKENEQNWQRFQILPKIISKCEKEGLFTTVLKNPSFRSMDYALVNLHNRAASPTMMDKFPSLIYTPQSFIESGKLNDWDKSLQIPPQIDTPLALSSMDLFKATLSETAKGTEVVKHIVTMKIPIDEFSRALLKGNLEQAANVISLGYDKLLLLKPVQLNFVENALVTTCESLLKPHLQTQNRNDTNDPQNGEKKNYANDMLEETIIKAYHFIRRLFDQIRVTNNYPSLDSSFLSAAEGTILANTVAESRADKMIDLVKNYTPVLFPNEYLNDLIPIEDLIALEYILNFYNFNLFGGRLPTSLHVKFAELTADIDAQNSTKAKFDEAGDDGGGKIPLLTGGWQGTPCEENITSHNLNLSTNDSNHSELGPVTIYLSNKLLETAGGDSCVISRKDKKILICKLLLDECVEIFKRSVNINEEYWSSELINFHLSHVIEKSNCWPFHYDEALPTGTPGPDHACGHEPHVGATVDKLSHTDRALLCMKNRYFRQTIDFAWESGKLPFRLINSLAYSGNLMMIESLLGSKQAIGYFTKLDYKQLLLYENLIKESVKSSFYGNTIELLAEAISAIDVSFENIRVEWHLHNLISSKTIMEGLIHSYNRQAEAMGEVCYEQKLYPFGPFGQFVALENNDFGPLQHLDVQPYIECLKKGTRKHLNGMERRDVLQNLYRYYNDKIFSNALPAVVKDPQNNETTCDIKFSDIWRSGILSNVEYTQDLKPIITIDEHVSDLKMLNDLLLLQMLKMHYMYKVNTAPSVFAESLPPDYSLVFASCSREIKRRFDEKYLASFKYPKTEHIAVHDTLKSLRISHFVNQVLEGHCKTNNSSKDKDFQLINVAIESSLYGFAHYLIELTDANADATDDNPISLTDNIPNFEYFRPLFEKLGLPYTIGQLDQEWISRLTDDEALQLSHITDVDDNIIGMLASAGFGIERILELLSPGNSGARTVTTDIENPVTPDEAEGVELERDDGKESMVKAILSEYEPKVIHYTGAVIDEILSQRVEDARRFIWSLDANVREQIITLSVRLIEGMKGRGAIAADIADKALKNLTQILL
ncbi:hypothetical protein BmR1_04g08610 [Babesia microti strain RI]|uniref:Uncharacterized protein n=1 Tax=Babesia microti (strain RI) TaxID=1133968 RepID=A0A1N6LY79_BABMR|nr:hypothetical protein BmR1_04g08610 [Babesia microti strain RI]SIO73825.1 hypothetical protein BmR1_04g08610 [Babesia microti strain RI]|eukprot:XP_021337881.1 hypothetical protein BmR1_04g08610 [Babesia microti strain RI]